MKKIKEILFLIAMTFILLFLEENKSYAAVKDNVQLKENKIYSYDLDGNGKKETIRYTVTGKDYDLTVTLYINGIKKYTADAGLFAEYTITDLNSNDNKLDLFLICTSDSATLDLAVFQQYNQNKIKTIEKIVSGKSLFGYANLYRISGLEKIKGDGSFSIVSDTPIYFSDVGSYFCHVPFTIQGEKISYKKVRTYTLTEISQEYKYTVNKNITIYEKPDIHSKKIKTLKNGENLNIATLRIIDNTSEFNKKGYAYVTDSSGSKGWIYLSGDSSWEYPMFKTTPAWG